MPLIKPEKTDTVAGVLELLEWWAMKHEHWDVYGSVYSVRLAIDRATKENKRKQKALLSRKVGRDR